jgi:hypothetical protein
MIIATIIRIVMRVLRNEQNPAREPGQRRRGR